MKERNYPIRTCSANDGCNIIHRNLRPVFHDQSPLLNGDVPHSARDGHIRAASLLRVKLATFGGQSGSLPYHRLAARQQDKRRDVRCFGFSIQFENPRRMLDNSLMTPQYKGKGFFSKTFCKVVQTSVFSIPSVYQVFIGSPN